MITECTHCRDLCVAGQVTATGVSMHFSCQMHCLEPELRHALLDPWATSIGPRWTPDQYTNERTHHEN